MLAVMVAEILRAGGGENGIGQVAAGARRRGRAVELGRTPRRADPAFARNRLVDDSDQRPPVLQERAQRAEARAARHEAARAVARVAPPLPHRTETESSPRRTTEGQDGSKLE